MDRVYMDNAATTKLSEQALTSMLPYLTEYYGNASSLHAFGREAAAALENARKSIAENLGALPKEVYFTSGGSEADNWAIINAARMGAKKGKKHIISTKFEHHAVLHTLQRLEKEGFEVTYLEVYSDGLVRVEDLSKSLREDTALVTIMFANNEIGTIQPITEIGKLCRSKGILFHTDAVQAVGHEYINVHEQSIDMLSLSAHKFSGPKGIGALFIRTGIPLPAYISGGSQERKKRAGTENIAAIVGMATALDASCKNMKTNNEKVRALRNRLIDELTKISHSRLNGDREKRLSGNVSLCFEGVEGEALLLSLDLKGISASSGSACTSGSLDPSHVLLAIGLPHEIAHGSLRLSLNENNTDKEVDYVIEVLPGIIERLREMSPVWEKIVKGEN